MNAGRSRAATLVTSSMQIQFCIDEPSNVCYHELITDVGMEDRDTAYYYKKKKKKKKKLLKFCENTILAIFRALLLQQFWFFCNLSNVNMFLLLIRFLLGAISMTR